MNVSFFFLFLPYFCTLHLTNYIEQENGEKDYGFVLISVIYMSMGFGAIFAPAIHGKLG